MKKILSVFVALALMLACIPVYVTAVETPTFSAGTVSAMPGDTVQIPIRIENNPGIMSCFISVSYDPAELTLTGADYCDLFTGGTAVPGGNLSLIPFNLLWYDYTANQSASGDFFELTFKVSENAVAGDKTITVTYSADNTFDENGDNVAFETQNGAVTVQGGWSFSEDCFLYTYVSENDENFICGVNSIDDPFMSDYIETFGGWSFNVEYNDLDVESTGSKLTILDQSGTAVEEYTLIYLGDVNGDGVINGMDIQLLLEIMTDSDTWDFLFTDELPQTFAADVNVDGTINGMDIQCIMDCIAHDDFPFQFIDCPVPER